MWQPRPYISYSAKEHAPMSWWFYKRCKGFDDLYERNKLGLWWSDFWFSLVNKIIKRGKLNDPTTTHKNNISS
jgi:hypothetical protein